MKPQTVKYMLMAQDMERAVSFYRDIMGFAEGFVSEHWSELKFGEVILALHGGGSGKRCETGLSIQYENVSVAHAAAVEAGATEIDSPERSNGEPIILSRIADPEGNVIMLTQYVAAD